MKPVKDAVNIVESYQPNQEIKTYVPKKVYLIIFEASTSIYLPTPVPSEKIEEWPTGLFKLNASYGRNLSKNEMDALSQLGLYTSFPELRLFKQDGVAYYVLGCLPSYEEIK